MQNLLKQSRSINIVNINWLIDWQLLGGWGTDSFNTEEIDFTIIYTIIVNYLWLNFWEWYFSDAINLCF